MQKSDNYFYNSQTQKMQMAQHTIVDRYSTTVVANNNGESVVSADGTVLPIADHSQSSSTSIYRPKDENEQASGFAATNYAAEYIGRSQFPTTKSGLLYAQEERQMYDNDDLNASLFNYKPNPYLATNTIDNNNAYVHQATSQDPIKDDFKRYRFHDNATHCADSGSFASNERFAQEILEKAGPAYAYQRKECMHDISSSSSDGNQPTDFQHLNQIGDYQQHTANFSDETARSASSVINQDPNPVRILKPNNQNLVYKQQVNIRYLQPPTPPPAAPIIIREKQLAQPLAQPPIIIRLDNIFFPLLLLIKKKHVKNCFFFLLIN
jgi:hypothetical protein